MSQSTTTERNPTAEMVTTVERRGTTKEIRIQKNTVIQNRKKQKEELLCLMMKTTGIGAKTMDIVVGEESDPNPERGSVAIAARGRRSRQSAPGMVRRSSSGTGRAVTLSSTGSPAGATTGAGRAPRTGGNSSQLQSSSIAKLLELDFKIYH